MEAAHNVLDFAKDLSITGVSIVTIYMHFREDDMRLPASIIGPIAILHYIPIYSLANSLMYSTRASTVSCVTALYRDALIPGNRQSVDDKGEFQSQLQTEDFAISRR